MGYLEPLNSSVACLKGFRNSTSICSKSLLCSSFGASLPASAKRTAYPQMHQEQSRESVAWYSTLFRILVSTVCFNLSCNPECLKNVVRLLHRSIQALTSCSSSSSPSSPSSESTFGECTSTYYLTVEFPVFVNVVQHNAGVANL